MKFRIIFSLDKRTDAYLSLVLGLQFFSFALSMLFYK